MLTHCFKGTSFWFIKFRDKRLKNTLKVSGFKDRQGLVVHAKMNLHTFHSSDVIGSVVD